MGKKKDTTPCTIIKFNDHSRAPSSTKKKTATDFINGVTKAPSDEFTRHITENLNPSDDMLHACSDDTPLPEVGEEEFYDDTGLPADKRIWHAYLVGYQNYLLNTGLEEELRHGYYQVNSMYPAKILAKYGDGSLDDEDALPANVFIAALTWQSVRDNPDLAKNDQVFDNASLDIIYDMIEYNAQRRPFASISQGAQAAVIANQIVITMQYAGEMENWAFKLFAGKLEPEDIKDRQAFYQNMITEKFSGDSPLEQLLDEQLGRLRAFINDEAIHLSKHQKRKAFKVIKGNKPL